MRAARFAVFVILLIIEDISSNSTEKFCRNAENGCEDLAKIFFEILSNDWESSICRNTSFAACSDLPGVYGRFSGNFNMSHVLDMLLDENVSKIFKRKQKYSHPFLILGMLDHYERCYDESRLDAKKSQDRAHCLSYVSDKFHLLFSRLFIQEYVVDGLYLGRMNEIVRKLYEKFLEILPKIVPLFNPSNHGVFRNMKLRIGFPEQLGSWKFVEKMMLGVKSDRLIEKVREIPPSPGWYVPSKLTNRYPIVGTRIVYVEDQNTLCKYSLKIVKLKNIRTYISEQMFPQGFYKKRFAIPIRPWNTITLNYHIR